MSITSQISEIAPQSASFKSIASISAENIAACYQCAKCTNGCPLTFAMDIHPHQVIHALQLGLVKELLSSDTIWVCASCETCTARCPNEIDIAHVMDLLRHASLREGVKESQRQSPIFHRTFLNSVKRYGRMHETSVALEYTLRSEGLKGLLKQAGLGWGMLRKGKMKLVPGRLKAGPEVDSIFRTLKRK